MNNNARVCTVLQHGWDLHCHTVYSDGTNTPVELVEQAVAKGLEGVAITDHDTTAGWRNASAASRRFGFPVLRGTEVTAECGPVSVHMLAYQYDPNNEGISGLFRCTREARLKRAKHMVGLLSEDFPISWQSVLEQVKEGSQTTIGRPHMADALVAAGVYRTRSEAFRGAVSASGKYYIPTPSPSAAEVVRVVRNAGGVSIVAHPADRSRNAVLLDDEHIRQLARLGLDGLEIRHRGNLQADRVRLEALAEELGLLVTGGSDWHGAGKPNRLGENVTDGDVVAEIVRRGAIDMLP
ncbi:PHP domain-containing protein [Bifidobacterium bohemicum]|nr:PHP domain-containing protein [Bifidobacterium bohemicum]